MAIKITDTEDEQYVSGDLSSAAVYVDHMYVNVGRNDFELTVEQAADLRDVLTAAIDLAYPAYVLTVEGESAVSHH